MKVYLNEVPRSFIISGDGSYALIIRHPYPHYKHQSHTHLHLSGSSNNGQGNDKNSLGSSKVLVEFVRKDLLNLSSYRDITPNRARLNKQLFGFLGLLHVGSNIYIGFITRQTKVASPMIGEDIYRIDTVDFYCLNSDEFDYLFNRSIEEEMGGTVAPPGQLEKDRLTTQYPASSVSKLLGLGSFFYSKDFDITSNLSERGVHISDKRKLTLVSDSPFFSRYLWNSYMINEFIEFRNRLSLPDRKQFDDNGFMTPITRGYAQTVNSYINQGEECLLTLISKQACKKNGPLFGDWGCDDNGAVSNFVETEVIIYTKKICFSYVIVRGNVPTFWELVNSNKKSLLGSKKNKKIHFPRSFEASQNAFNRHFERLINQYNEVRIVNCLSDDPKSYKGQLDMRLKNHISSLNENYRKEANKNSNAIYKLSYTDIPLTLSTMKKIGYSSHNPSDIVNRLVDSIIDFGALFYDISRQEYIGKQLGIFRVDSFNSLAKADLISKIITQEVIELAFRDIGITADHDLYIKHSQLWAENNDHLTKITVNYASNSSKLQRSSDASTKSSVKSHLSKKYLSGVMEPKPSEMAMLKLLGRLQDQVNIVLCNPIHDYVTRELNKRSKEYSYDKDISIFSCTFNVNGSCYKESITDWIFPEGYKAYDLVFVGIQEIVELSAGQMVNTDPTNKIFWENKIKKTLTRYNSEGVPYISLWSGHIGGIALFLYVKETEVSNINNVEGAFKKTGFGGMSANKGGIAVSFYYSNTEICFVCSHLAAGLSNVDERHQNYKTIAKGIKFSKNRRIKDHDAVIWVGDFNFRIDLPIEQVKYLIDKKDYGRLFEFDQLNKQMASGETFPFYDEMEITFSPTYKFDHDSNNYDTSEKQRIPAWTDRILHMSRNNIIKQLSYNSVDSIRFSDHRPVYALFTMSVNIINEAIKRNLENELQEEYRKNVGDINESLIASNNIHLLFHDEFNNKDLPPPSSELRKWWLEGGRPAKINIPELNNSGAEDGYIINPRLPSNPFTPVEMSEFVSKKSVLDFKAHE